MKDIGDLVIGDLVIGENRLFNSPFTNRNSPILLQSQRVQFFPGRFAVGAPAAQFIVLRQHFS